MCTCMCMCVCTHMCMYAVSPGWRAEDNLVWSYVSHLTIWVLGIQLRSWGLVAGAFTPRPPCWPQTDFLFGFLLPLICLWTLEEVSSSFVALLYCPDDLWTSIFPSHQQIWTNVTGFLPWKNNKLNWEGETTRGSHAPSPCLFPSGRLELLCPLLRPLS